MEAYRILMEGGSAEIVEKKSRFIATIAKVDNEEQATAFIEETKKKYWDARHNCSAFVIGEKAQLTRCSDDGEPSGTAGRPMLEILLSEEIRNIAVVVTRYFGGVLLGTGGLVRAYSGALKAGLEVCKIGVMKAGVRVKITTDYTGIGKIQYILAQQGIEPLESEYTDNVCLYVIIPTRLKNVVEKEVTEATSGKAHIEVLEEIYYVDKE